MGISPPSTGGMVLIAPSGGFSTYITDTVRGDGLAISTAEDIGNSSTNSVAFNSNGFVIPAAFTDDISSQISYALALTCREKFLSIVQYAGNGTTQAIAHGLKAAPGMIWIKRVNAAADWPVWHTGDPSSYYFLNSSSGFGSSVNVFGNNVAAVSPGSATFTVGSASEVNASGSTYIAYVFGHSASSSENISCGSFTTDGAGAASLSLPWEPGIFFYTARAGGQWDLLDEAAGMGNNGDRFNLDLISKWTYPADTFVKRNSSGMEFSSHAVSAQYIYMAIKRARPTSSRSGNVDVTVGAVSNYIEDTGAHCVDLLIHRRVGAVANWIVSSKLAGYPVSVLTNSSAAASTGARDLRMGRMLVNGLPDSGGSSTTQTDKFGVEVVGGFGQGFQHLYFSRSKAIYDGVVFTGNATNRTIAHDLGVVPDLWIVKNHTSAQDWVVGSRFLAANEYLVLNSNAAKATDATIFNGVVASATSFGVGTSSKSNANTEKIFAHLFGTNLSGSSYKQRVGTYTGNGGTLAVDCGFSFGVNAFVIIKRVDATGDWLVFGNNIGTLVDFPTSLNSSAAGPLFSEGAIAPSAGGFSVTQEATRNVNVNASTYIYIAVGI